METSTIWDRVFIESTSRFGETFLGALPNIIGAILIILLGLLIAKIFRKVFYKVLVKFYKIKVVKESLLPFQGKEIKKDEFAKVGSGIFYWIIIFLFSIAASETLGWTSVAQELSLLISKLPGIFSAIVLFLIGFYLARLIRDAIYVASNSFGVGAGKFLSEAAFYFLLFFIGVSALSQAHVDTSLLEKQSLVLVGALFLAVTLAYGIGARELLGNIIAGIYCRSRFDEGQTISILGFTGQVSSVGLFSLTIDDSGNEIVIPMKQVLNQHMEIFKHPRTEKSH